MMNFASSAYSLAYWGLKPLPEESLNLTWSFSYDICNPIG